MFPFQHACCVSSTTTPAKKFLVFFKRWPPWFIRRTSAAIPLWLKLGPQTTLWWRAGGECAWLAPSIHSLHLPRPRSMDPSTPESWEITTYPTRKTSFTGITSCVYLSKNRILYSYHRFNFSAFYYKCLIYGSNGCLSSKHCLKSGLAWPSCVEVGVCLVLRLVYVLCWGECMPCVEVSVCLVLMFAFCLTQVCCESSRWPFSKSAADHVSFISLCQTLRVGRWDRADERCGQGTCCAPSIHLPERRR